MTTLLSARPLLEAGERLCPEPVDPVAENCDACGIELVQVPRSVAPMRDEADVLENAQVLRDRGPAHGQIGSEIADRPRPRLELLEDVTSRGVAQRIERVSVSNHLP
jgi:hypothetical protein